MLTRRLLLSVPLTLLALAGAASAAEIRDDAGLFGADAVREARAKLDRVESEYGVPVALRTVESLRGESVTRAAERFARAEDWHGLFALMSKSDHKIEVIVSSDYRPYFPASRLVAMRDAFISEFKSGDYDAGLTRGIAAIDQTASEAKVAAGGTLRPVATAVRPSPAPAPRFGARRPAAARSSFATLLIIGIGIVAVLFVIRLLGGAMGGRAGYGRPGYGQPGYGQPGYGGMQPRGGFMSGMLGGLGGAIAGNWLYDRMSGRGHYGNEADVGGYGGDVDAGGGGVDYSGTGGADWGGGGDVGGGGDWGGGGGGDWGGGGGDGGSW